MRIDYNNKKFIITLLIKVTQLHRTEIYRDIKKDKQVPIVVIFLLSTLPDTLQQYNKRVI